MATIELGTGAVPTSESDGASFAVLSPQGIFKYLWASAPITTDAAIALRGSLKHPYTNPSVCYDPDRKCWVMAILGGAQGLSDEDGSLNSWSYPEFYTITSDADGGAVTPLFSASYNPRILAHSTRAFTRATWEQDDKYNTIHVHYDADNDQVFVTGDYRYAGHGNDERGQWFGTFRGRTTAAGGGAADATTRALVYGASNMKEFIGFTTAQATNTDTATITVAGGLNENQSGLTRGKKYFIDDGGLLIDKIPDIGMNLFVAGVTTDTTKLLVQATNITPM